MAKEFNQGLKTALKLIAYLDDNEAQNEKTAIALAVALAGFRYRSASRSKDNTQYTGAKLGWSQYHDTGFYGNGYQNGIGNGPTHKDQLGAGAFSGYRANQYRLRTGL